VVYPVYSRKVEIDKFSVKQETSTLHVKEGKFNRQLAIQRTEWTISWRVGEHSNELLGRTLCAVAYARKLCETHLLTVESRDAVYTAPVSLATAKDSIPDECCPPRKFSTSGRYHSSGEWSTCRAHSFNHIHSFIHYIV
jgi:hypothetical protein